MYSTATKQACPEALDNPLLSGRLPAPPKTRAAADRVIRCSVTTTPQLDELLTSHYLGYMRDLCRAYPFWELKKIGRSSGVLFEEYDGLTEYSGRRRVGVPKTVFALEHKPEQRKRGLIFITAGHHGPESAGPAAALCFASRLAQSDSRKARELKRHYRICVVPVVDVDNFSRPYAERTYSHLNNWYHELGPGPDLERSGPGVYRPVRAGPAARGVARALRRLSDDDRLLLTFDLHESWYKLEEGFFIVQHEDSRDAGLAEAAVKRFKRVGLPMDSVENERSGVVYSWGGVSFSEFTESLGGISYSLESPRFLRDITGRARYVSGRRRVEMHLQAMDAIIDGFLSKFRRR